MIKIMVGGLWLAVIVFWIARAFGNKATVVSQSFRKPLMLPFFGIVVVILLVDKADPEFFDRSFVSDGALAGYLGLILTLVGLGFGVWARMTIGSNWSGFVTLKRDHALIQTGPYALVRHPIYTALCVAMFGTAVVFNKIEGLAIVLAVFIMLVLKSRIEEKLMLQEFGDQYTHYSQKVRGFIPFVW